MTSVVHEAVAAALTGGSEAVERFGVATTTRSVVRARSSRVAEARDDAHRNPGAR